MFKKSINDAKSVLKKGNVFMLAIGLLLGTVFSALVSSFANDILMAAIKHNILPEQKTEWVVAGMNVGKFLGALMTFVIVTLFIFIILIVWFLIVNYRASKKSAPAPVAPKPTTEELILEELKKLNSKK